jgi:hypothetical protein
MQHFLIMYTTCTLSINVWVSQDSQINSDYYIKALLFITDIDYFL